MTRHLIALAITALALSGSTPLTVNSVEAAERKAGDLSAALARFKTAYHSPAFGEPRLAPQGYLLLPATSVFVSTSSAGRTGLVHQALDNWRESQVYAGKRPGPLLASVVWEGGGGLWRLDHKEVNQLDGWSDDQLGYDPETVRGGRLFGFLGAQFVRGDVDSTGFNARLGSTMFQDRYDFALTFGHTSVNSSNFNTIGLMGRALFPINDKLGWNAGAQLVEASGSGVSQTIVGLVAGLNLYLPGGSLDLTLQVGNHSTYGLLAGYTFFLNSR